MAEHMSALQALNRHPAPAAGNAPSASSSIAYRVGVCEDRNRKCRRTMEDSHSFVYDFGGVKGQGYFAVFEWVALATYPSDSNDGHFAPHPAADTRASTPPSGAAKTSTNGCWTA